MSGRIESVTTYVAILVVLLLLTILTVAISLFDLSQEWHVAAGLSIAVVKASLVALFFMHALVSPRATWCVIIAAVVWVLILFVLTFADYWTREAIPYMPGH